MKECSNQKVEENKPALKFNFTLEFNWGGMFLNNFDSQRALIVKLHPNFHTNILSEIIGLHENEGRGGNLAGISNFHVYQRI